MNKLDICGQKIYEKPVTSNRKVYIINNSDTMTKEAQNSLLKVLEEPPEYASIILIASNENKLLNTIRSRCIKINFNKLNEQDIIKYCTKNNINIDKNIISHAGGSIGKTIKIQNSKEEYQQVEEIIDKINKKDLIHILNNSEVLYKSKENIFDLLDYINVLLIKTNEIQKINCIKYVEEAKKRLNNNSNYDMTIDWLLMNMFKQCN